MKVVAILQARMTSSRLPGKVLMDINGHTMLESVVQRVGAARTVDQVVIATTEEPTDDLIVAFCATHELPVIRGSLNDVLARFVKAALTYSADVIVRVTTDCPLADPDLIDEVVDHIVANNCDYVSNRLPPEPRTIPIGLDVEAITLSALMKAHEDAQLPSDREHVTSYIYNHQEIFHCVHLKHPEIGHGDDRWTVDTPEDIVFVRRIYPVLTSTSWKDTMAAIEGLHMS